MAGKRHAEIDRVLDCETLKPYQMLGIPETASKPETLKAWKKLALAIHPDKVDKDWKERGTKAFRKVQEAAKTQGFKKKHFAENAFSSEDPKAEDTTTGKGEDTTIGDAPPWEDTIPKSGVPQQAVYEKATDLLKALWENPTDPGAIQELESLNKSIISLNVFSGLSTDEADGFIIETNWFRTQLSSMKLLQQEALPKTINIAIQLFDEKNKRHGYPDNWNFQPYVSGSPVFSQSTSKAAEERKEQDKQKEQKEQVQQKEQKVQDQQKVHEGYNGPGFKPGYIAKGELIDRHQMVGYGMQLLVATKGMSGNVHWKLLPSSSFIWTVVDAYMLCARAKQLEIGNVEGVYLKVLNVAQATSKSDAHRLPVTFVQVEWFDKEEPFGISRSALRKLLGRKPADDEIAAVIGVEEASELPGYPQMSLRPPPPAHR
ncbi:hypothetical protein C7212DRAFT_348297 [Tuber magnatum]|uniref:J domain-containing protein n=1 Tax=Tuber magnatum TaxID=42249 RepID=A0A317SDA2_9PEZI|nr:hypothetical protein C7212DRAFT_348297 [Tuber magnatum]